MKVGIFTVTRVLNYGAHFQMIGLHDYLTNLGHEVIVFSPEISLKRKLLRFLAMNPERIFRKNILRNRLEKEEKRVDMRIYKSDKLDLAIFGSDEIWNIENPSFQKSYLYFGVGVNANKKIAYAPSIGYATLEAFSENQYIKNGLDGFERIFHRDNATKRMVDTLKLSSERVADPTILFNGWSRATRDFKFKGSKYVVYYSYVSNPSFKEDLIKWSRKKGYKIVSSGYDKHEWADYNLLLSPSQFLGLLRNSEGVFTTTFHGSIMSFMMGKKPVVDPSGQKVTDFLEFIEQSDCLYRNDQWNNLGFEHFFASHNDDSVTNRINEWSNESREKIAQFIEF